MVIRQQTVRRFIQLVIDDLANELDGATLDDAGDKEPISFEFGTLTDCEERVKQEKSRRILLNLHQRRIS